MWVPILKGLRHLNTIIHSEKSLQSWLFLNKRMCFGKIFEQQNNFIDNKKKFFFLFQNIYILRGVNANLEKSFLCLALSKAFLLSLLHNLWRISLLRLCLNFFFGNQLALFVNTWLVIPKSKILSCLKQSKLKHQKSSYTLKSRVHCLPHRTRQDELVLVLSLGTYSQSIE